MQISYYHNITGYTKMLNRPIQELRAKYILPVCLGRALIIL